MRRAIISSIIAFCIIAGIPLLAFGQVDTIEFSESDIITLPQSITKLYVQEVYRRQDVSRLHTDAQENRRFIMPN